MLIVCAVYVTCHIESVHPPYFLSIWPFSSTLPQEHFFTLQDSTFLQLQVPSLPRLDLFNAPATQYFYIGMPYQLDSFVQCFVFRKCTTRFSTCIFHCSRLHPTRHISSSFWLHFCIIMKLLFGSTIVSVIQHISPNQSTDNAQQAFLSHIPHFIVMLLS